MLNRSALSQTIPPAIAPTIPSANTPRAPILNRARWLRVVGMFRLPSTLRGYMAFLASLLVLAFTMTLHIMLSAEIMRLNVGLYNLQQEYARVERYNANIVWRIAEHSSLVELHDQAVTAGYVNTVPTEYVDMPLASQFTVDPNAPAILPDSISAEPSQVTDPNAPQPAFTVIMGEPALEDAASATNGSTPRFGALSGQQPQSVKAPSWWEQNTPEWLRFERVGDAIGETVEWIREHIPSAEWLQQRW